MKRKLSFGLLVLFALTVGVSAQTVQQTPEPAKIKKAKDDAVKAGTEIGKTKVAVISVGEQIKDKKLLGEASEFDSSVGVVWCWTKIISEDVPTIIKHVWYLDGKNVAQVSLNIKYPSFRTWSRKNIGPGKWEVKVLDENGGVLASVKFIVKDSAQSEAEKDSSEKSKIE